MWNVRSMNQDKVVKQKIPCGFHQWLSGKTSICNAGDMVDSQVRTLGREDPMEKEMATHIVFLPGNSHGQRSLVGNSSWGQKESETIEHTYKQEIKRLNIYVLGISEQKWTGMGACN